MNMRRFIRDGGIIAVVYYAGFFAIRFVLNCWDPSHIAQISSHWWSATGLFWKIYLFPMDLIPVPPHWQGNRGLIYTLVLGSSLAVGLIGAMALAFRRASHISWLALVLNIIIVSGFGFIGLHWLGIGAFGSNYRDVIFPLVFFGPIVSPLAIIALHLSRPLTVVRIALAVIDVLWFTLSVIGVSLGALFAALWGASGIFLGLVCGVLLASVWLTCRCVIGITKRWRHDATDASVTRAKNASDVSH
ncbi:MAG: hypothetical protein NTY53_01570 [Kiritimatiellaeota bacterium]|nr:hypothetical protein [Kiritimatiellota bacterium]